MGRSVPCAGSPLSLATARGALDVGFVVTVSPKGSLDLRVRKDGKKVEAKSTAKPLEIEASAEVEIAIADIATVHVRGGRREAQEKAQGLENSWGRDVEPHLVAAGVADLDGLDAKIAECRELDAGIKAKDAEVESLRTQIAALTGAAEALREASNRAETCRAALGDVQLDTLAADLKALGADPIVGLRKRRQELLKEAEGVRAIANDAATPRPLPTNARGTHSRRWMRPSHHGMPRCRPSRKGWMRHWSPQGLRSRLVSPRRKRLPLSLLRWSVRLTSGKNVSTRSWAALAQMPLRPRMPSIRRKES